MLINTKNADEKRENVKEIENKILDLEDRIKEMNEKEKKNVKETLEIINELFNYYFNYLSPDIMFERLRDSSDEKNKSMVESINEKLTKLKNIVKNVPKDEVSKFEENEKIIDLVERILELNSKV